MGAGASAADDINAPEIHQWYTKFMRECPSGQLSLYEFKTLLDLHGLNPQADTYVDQVFNTFDLNKDGFIDFLEFIAAINLVIRGKIDQKLKWYFKLYDADGNGSIDKKELLSIFTVSKSYTVAIPFNIAHCLWRSDLPWELTLEEFINGVESDASLLELISKSFDLSNVLKVIQSGRRPEDSLKNPTILLYK
uniref:Guanylate cyclase activator 1C n=1 Tax=Terrapene triunguis TaxID=2587831 RepID=A0A674K727_9SAUR